MVVRVVYIDLPVKVELVKIRTIFELTGGKDSKEPAKIKSTVLSSIVNIISKLEICLI